jgi:uncharacterized membrane protein YjgN (DUF898 family)
MKIFLRILSVISLIVLGLFFVAFILSVLVKNNVIEGSGIVISIISYQTILIWVELILICIIVPLYILSKHSFNKKHAVQCATNDNEEHKEEKKEEAKTIQPLEPKKEETVAVVAADVATTPTVVENKSASITQNIGKPEDSYFDGGLLQLIGINLLNNFLFFITIGIIFPRNLTRQKRWYYSHTYINGRRLKFTGTGGSLIGNWIKWMLLTIITLGIYGLWLPIKLKKWEVAHTIFEDTINNN